MNVLVCGGAGFIGSHMVKALAAAGHQPITYDNLSTGHRDAVLAGEFVQGDLLHTADLAALFRKHPIDLVMHFAARSLVGESMHSPELYYANNVTGTHHLLEAMRTAGVQRIVFSSTAAIFGNPEYTPIDEAHPKAPINPYGRTKWMIEQMLADYAGAHGLDSVSLRYFNAAGCDPDGELGERHDPETHLIPNILRAALASQDPDKHPAPALKIFGDDYDTPDGTCLRDYIHVTDLCAAHLCAIEFLQANPGCHAFNLGNGQGFSVKEVLKTAEDVVGFTIPHTIEARRPGDPPVLVASADAAREQLGWKPERAGLEGIVRSVWDYLRSNTSS